MQNRNPLASLARLCDEKRATVTSATRDAIFRKEVEWPGRIRHAYLLLGEYFIDLGNVADLKEVGDVRT
jgi:hypothetical protein